MTNLKKLRNEFSSPIMIQDSIVIRNRHRRFIKVVCKTGIVYGLESKDGFASSSSVHFEDEDENPIGIICFWAEKALAKSCIKNGWSDYEITEIPLPDFIENWCIGMGGDGLIVGTEFDQNMFGFEADPLELIIDLLNELEVKSTQLKFAKFKSNIDLKSQVQEILNYENE